MDGWQAESTVLSINKNTSIPSFRVIECPMFKKMDLAGRGSHLTASEVQDLAAIGMLFAMGENDAEIAAQTGMSRRTVARRRILWMRQVHGGEEVREGDEND